MLENGDVFVYVLILLLIIMGVIRPWRRKQTKFTPVPTGGKMLDLLEGEGYEVVSGKLHLRLTVMLGGREVETNVSADHLVRKHGQTYIVKVESNAESETQLTPKRVRERYLSACFAFRAGGVVVVSADKTRLKHVDITIARSPLDMPRWRWTVASFLIGSATVFFWLY